jgi:hypothetical protein
MRDAAGYSEVLSRIGGRYRDRTSATVTSCDEIRRVASGLISAQSSAKASRPHDVRIGGGSSAVSRRIAMVGSVAVVS